MRVLKGIVFALVLANVAYFLWSRGVALPGQPSRFASVPRLTLASEVAPRTASSAAPAASAASVASVAGTSAAGESALAPPAAMRCVGIGPFLDAAEAARAAATLRRGGYRPRQRVAEGEVWAGVWVYLAMPPSAAAVSRLLKRLKAAGIEGAMVMPGPNDASVISLGLFSEMRRAQARITRARSIGLRPLIAERKRSGDVYWIDVDLKPSDPNLNASDLGASNGRIVRLQVVACPGK